jgi:hypothetical protein
MTKGKSADTLGPVGPRHEAAALPVAGDVVEMGITGLGTQRHVVVEEKAGRKR